MTDSPMLFGGIDLGGTKILSLVVDADLNVVGRDLRPTEAAAGVETIVQRMAASLIAAANGRPLAAVGLPTAGPSNPDSGIVSASPNLPGWRDVPLTRLLSEALALPVRIENDCNGAALAEHRLGAGRGSRHMVQVTVGTGIGGGIIIDGRLYHGAS